jgi:hypothetical protein
MDGYLLAEIWSVVKQYVPAKEMQSAADQLVNLLMDQNLSTEDFSEFVESDSYLRRAAEEYSVAEMDFESEDDLDQD